MNIAAESKITESTELNAAYLNGDREAFAEIVRRHQNMVTAVTFSITGNLQQSEDLAQETFIAAWRSLSELREPAKLSAWLCGIARNLSRKWLRKTETERQARSETPVEDIPEASADDTVRKEQAELLWSTIKSIPEHYREPLVMYYRQEQSVTEIATALELSEDNVRQRIARGRKMLKAEVEKHVESVLKSTRPDTAFTLAVLASIPLASATGCATATVGIGGAGGLGSSGLGGGASGMGIFGVILAVLAAVVGLLIQSAMFIVLWLVYLWFLQLAFKGSPTARTRRFVVGAALDYAVIGIVLTSIGRLTLPLVREQNFFSTDFYFWFGFMPVELRSFLVSNLPQCIVLAGFMLYVILRWRRLLHEDLTETDQSRACQDAETAPTENEEKGPWHQVLEPERRLFAGIAAGCGRWLDGFLTIEGLKKKFFVVLGIVAVALLFSWYETTSFFYRAFMQGEFGNASLVWSIIGSAWVVVLTLVFQTAFFRLMWHDIRISGDEQAVETWKTPSVLESLGPESRHRVLVDALVLMAAIPLVIQLIAVGLGIARQIMNVNNPYYMPLDSVMIVVRLQIVLIAVAALYVSARPARRYAVFALLFFISGLVTFYCFEYAPLWGVAAGPVFQRLFWWLPMDGFQSPLPFWDMQRMYLFAHLMTLLGGGYLFLASALCLLIHRIVCRRASTSQ